MRIEQLRGLVTAGEDFGPSGAFQRRLAQHAPAGAFLEHELAAERRTGIVSARKRLEHDRAVDAVAGGVGAERGLGLRIILTDGVTLEAVDLGGADKAGAPVNHRAVRTIAELFA